MREITISITALALVLVIFSCTNQALATAPASDLLASKLIDTLKSITSNVSASIQDDVDKVISGTMDILIDSSMSHLGNATILENSDSSPTVKYNLPNISPYTSP